MLAGFAGEQLTYALRDDWSVKVNLPFQLTDAVTLAAVRKKVRALFSNAQLGMPGTRIPTRPSRSNIPGRWAVSMSSPQPPTATASSAGSASARTRFSALGPQGVQWTVDDQNRAVAADRRMPVPESIRSSDTIL